ncbi:hypothetical protein C2845_PM04G14480 [Panicum miliaceum]|uniref:Uncharacterized protein n=1 Tax=Panicum miliaceum TaxID=4540 RepID=A0A3L6QQJ9_PANMI|nr:hypothetical protein C2845_PM04G14480 [Panicum miliaceum]
MIKKNLLQRGRETPNPSLYPFSRVARRPLPFHFYCCSSSRKSPSYGIPAAPELRHARHRPELRRPRRRPPARAATPAPPPPSCGTLAPAQAAAPAPPPPSCGALAAGPSCGAHATGPELWPGRRQPRAAACSPPPLPSSDLPVVAPISTACLPRERRARPCTSSSHSLTSAASVHLLRCPCCRSSRHLLLCGLRTSVATSRSCRPSPAGQDPLRLIQEGAEHGIQCDSTSGKLTT